MKESGICGVCQEMTDSGCLRCRAPLCGEHLPEDKKRCQRCEASYLERVAPIDEDERIRRFYDWSPLGTAGALARMALWTALVPPAVILGLCLNEWGAPVACLRGMRRAEDGLWPSRLKWERRRFLLERPARIERRLPAGD